LPFSSNSDVDILMTILASVVLFFAMFVGKRHILERWQGVAMIIIYLSYVAFLIMKQ